MGNPNEMFDVVNEKDEVTGCERRSVVHARGLMHRAVHVLLFNSKGDVFLQKRSPKKDLHPDVWDSSSSGHVDSGEDYDTAAARELVEELGVERKILLRRVQKLSACRETGMEFVWVYEGRDEGPYRLNEEEISEGRFFSREELGRWLLRAPKDFAPAFVYLWEICFSRVV